MDRLEQTGETPEQPLGSDAAPASHENDGTTADPDARASERAPAAAADRQGWIPPDVHARILDRYHDRLERLAWAADLDPDEVREALASRRRPGRAQDGGNGNGHRGEEGRPQPDAQDERGQRYYTPEQAVRLAEYVTERAIERHLAQFGERLAPIESTVASVQDRQRQDALNAQIAEAMEWPGFSDHVEAITDAIAQRNRDRRLDPRLPKLTLEQAYINIAVPKLSSTAKKKVVEDINNNTKVTRDNLNPERRHSSSRKPDAEKSTAELLREEMAARRA